jgi:hypothetical protein
MAQWVEKLAGGQSLLAQGHDPHDVIHFLAENQK